jgi:hypothetical protein
MLRSFGRLRQTFKPSGQLRRRNFQFGQVGFIEIAQAGLRLHHEQIVTQLLQGINHF